MHTYKHTYVRKYMHTIGRQTERQSDRQTDIHTHYLYVCIYTFLYDICGTHTNTCTYVRTHGGDMQTSFHRLQIQLCLHVCAHLYGDRRTFAQ